jgi:hypothetical protein
MKKLYPGKPNVSQAVANRTCQVIQRFLRQHRVVRASDLPEEGRIRLYQHLQPVLSGGSAPGPKESAWSVLWSKISDFLEG